MNDINASSTHPLRSGRHMPVLGLGTWQLKRDSAACVAHALDLGFRMIDTSGDYGTQPAVGRAVRNHGHRDDLFVVTKVEEDEDAFEAAREDLEELGLDYVDLLLLHRPPERGAGEELWRGLMRAREEGLARDIGVSNYSIARLEQLADATGEMPAVNQIEWTPFGHSDAMLQFCVHHGIVIQAYSPLTRAQRLEDETLREIATANGKSPAQVLLRWDLQLGVVPLPKANRMAHQREDFDVFDFELSDEDMHALSGLNQRYSSLGSLPYE